MSSYGEIPFTEGTFVLKQTQPELTQLELALLDYFAPGFHHRKDGIPGNDPDALIARLGTNIQYVADRQRRFAGDKLLPRSRYFSVCNSNDGDDRGTMTSELRAYSDYRATGPINIIDTTAPTVVPQYFEDLFRGKPAIVFIPYHSRALGNSFAEFLKLDPSEHSKDRYGAVSLSVIAVQMTKVIDLRDLHSADWFAYHLTRLRFSDLGNQGNQRQRDLPCFPLGPADDFKSILPVLLNADLGSTFGDATQIAGVWLRRIGANALIFPSARCNMEATVRDGRVVDWYGWNLVDYRGAPTPELTAMTSFTTWDDKYPLRPSQMLLGKHADPSVAYLGVTIELQHDDSGSTLKVSHYEEQQQALKLNQAWAFCVDRLREKLPPDDISLLLDFPLAVAQRSPSAEYLQTLNLKVDTGAFDLSFPLFDDAVGRIVRIDDSVGVGTHFYDTIALASCCADLIGAALQIRDVPERLLQKCEDLSRSSVAQFVPAIRKFATLVLRDDR
jgi:hypothetical protein